MKNCLVILIACIPFLAFGQNEAIEHFYKKYTELENVTDISIEGNLIKMTASYADDENSEKLLRKVSKLRVLAIGEENIVRATDKKALLKGIRQAKFEELIKVREGKSLINILIREHENYITNALLIIDAKDDFLLLSLEGIFQWSDFDKMDFEIEGAEHLQKISKNKNPERA